MFLNRLDMQPSAKEALDSLELHFQSWMRTTQSDTKQ
jgi:hypothetical protein